MGYTRLRYTSQGDARYTAYYWDLRGRQCSADTFTRQRTPSGRAAPPPAS
ncbi:hypothetical protein ACH347_29910 [Saccharopolyspora sp. 5N102]